MSSLKKPETVNDIVAALKTLFPEITGVNETLLRSYWTLIIGALYDRITADLKVQLVSNVVPSGSLTSPSGAVSGATTVANPVSEVV